MTKEWATKISRVLDGRVLIRGYSHEGLIGDRSYAAGVFLTLRGELPTAAELKMTEALLNSLLDHGFVAASVLAARYCASGNPQVIPAAAAGLLTAGSNTISPQHGAQFIEDAFQVMKRDGLTLEATAQRVVEQVRASKRRIPGYGHPTHKAGDFRATKLWKVAEECGFIGERTRLYQAIHREFVAVTGKTGLCINVDGALACIMTEMGFRPLQMVSIAVLAVMPGILAHVIEEIEEGKALRIVRDADADFIGVPERALPATV
ncbi:MAG: citryl-CoA lyase [Gammaproteobacteria bacterium]